MGAASPLFVESVIPATSTPSYRPPLVALPQDQATQRDLGWVGLLLCTASAAFSLWAVSRVIMYFATMF